MIHMPRRSVTRYFIPLIDVLLLLFGVFLLMPMVAEESKSLDEARTKNTAARLEAKVKILEKELEKLPDRATVAELIEERDRLKELLAAPVRDRIYVRIIDVDPKGSLLYHDETHAGKGPFRIAKIEEARYLIDKHTKEAGMRSLFYVFNIEDPTRFTIGQRDMANRFFKGVETSLPAEKEGPK
jgi:hypothetical protein